MATNPTRHFADLLSAPLEQLLASLGAGIGRSQAALDRHSIEIQKLIDEDPSLAPYGLEATWYQIPTTELELKVAVALEEQAVDTTSPAATVGGLADVVLRRPPRLWIQPMNPTVSNVYNYDAQAATTVKLSVVAVPPPGRISASPAIRTEAEVLATAEDDLVQNPALNVTANFNPGTRIWYVVQTDETETPPKLRALVRVSDETGNVLSAERPS